MLHPVRILAISAVLGTPRGLNIGRLPWGRPERAQGGGGVERPRADLHVVRLEDDAALIGPEALELEDQVLEGQSLRLVGFERLDHVFSSSVPEALRQPRTLFALAAQGKP